MIDPGLDQNCVLTQLLHYMCMCEKSRKEESKLHLGTNKMDQGVKTFATNLAELNQCNPHDGKGEPTSAHCSLTSAHT